jgi:hypothetical protein
MKTEKIERKLVINKKTVANLKTDEMEKVNGGTYVTFHTYSRMCHFNVNVDCGC